MDAGNEPDGSIMAAMERLSFLPNWPALTEPAGSTCLVDPRVSFQEAQFEECLFGENIGMDFFSKFISR